MKGREYMISLDRREARTIMVPMKENDIRCESIFVQQVSNNALLVLPTDAAGGVSV